LASENLSGTIRFLGLLCDSLRQAFLLPYYKKLKFHTLRERICPPRVGVKTLQRIAGKLISFSLVVPGCNVRETFKAISHLSRSSKQFSRVEGSLRAEFLYWRFLDQWMGCLPWRYERHSSVSLCSDASKRAWGAFLVQDG